MFGIHVPAHALAPLALTIVVTAFACVGIGLFNASLGLRWRETAVIGNLLLYVLLIFAGVNVPLSRLPGWMSTLAQGLPVTHGANAARQLIAGASLGHVAAADRRGSARRRGLRRDRALDDLAVRARGPPRRDAGSRVADRRISIAPARRPLLDSPRDPRPATRDERRRHARGARVDRRRRHAARVLARARPVRVGRGARRARAAARRARDRTDLGRRAGLRCVAASPTRTTSSRSASCCARRSASSGSTGRC